MRWDVVTSTSLSACDALAAVLRVRTRRRGEQGLRRHDVNNEKDKDALRGGLKPVHGAWANLKPSEVNGPQLVLDGDAHAIWH